jgi:uncharacterized protein involved in tellurium resistance
MNNSSFNPLDLDPLAVLPRLDAAKMVFALALKRVLPNACPLTARQEGFSFKALFSLKGPLPPLFLSLMQEEMRRIKKEAISLKRQEMLRSNAASFLRHHRFSEKAGTLEEEDEEVVPFIRMGDYLDEPFSQKTLESSDDLGVVQLLYCNLLEEGIFEAAGTAFGDEKEAKNFLKLYKDDAKRRGKASLVENGMITSPQGIETREKLFSSSRTAWNEFDFKEIVLLEEVAEEAFGEIVSKYPKGAFWHSLSKDEALLFCPKGRENTEMHHLDRFVSSWMEKVKNSPYEKLEEKGRVSWYLIDPIGVRYPVASIEFKKNLGLIRISLIGHLESWLAF